MGRVSCVFFLLLLSSSSPAFAEPAQFCLMSKDEAHASPLCVRWYFECRPQGSSERTEALDPKERLKLHYNLAFTLAARRCQKFSYQEAEAALSAHLRGLR